MPAKTTREVLESYLKCQYKGYLKLGGAQGSTSDYEILLRETRARLRVAAAANLVRDHKRDVLRDLALTFEVLKRGAPLLLDVTAEDEHMTIRFDGLRRSAGSAHRYFDFVQDANDLNKLGAPHGFEPDYVGCILAPSSEKATEW
jgi:hypothetical protein